MKLHVLHVGNEKLIIQSFSAAFLQSDSLYKCTCVEDIDHAIKILDFVEVDFLFVDLDPSVGETLEFIAQVKKKFTCKKLKIVTYSANCEFYQCVSKAYGAHFCTARPVTSQLIYHALHSFDIHTLARGESIT